MNFGIFSQSLVRVLVSTKSTGWLVYTKAQKLHPVTRGSINHVFEGLAANILNGVMR
jgi:hypothetical protein